MRIITKEIKIFTLEEVFEQAVRNHRYINVEDNADTLRANEYEFDEEGYIYE